MNWRRLHAWAAILWVAAIIAQVVLAGQAIGNLGGSGDFATHRDFGYTMGIVQLIALVLAYPARMSRRDKGISAGLLILYIVQTILPPLRSGLPFIAELHPLNAMVLFTLSVWYAWHAWRIAAVAPSETSRVADAAEAAAKAG
jgi:heme A synthase